MGIAWSVTWVPHWVECMLFICTFESQTKIQAFKQGVSSGTVGDCRNAAALNPLTLNLPLISSPINHAKQAGGQRAQDYVPYKAGSSTGLAWRPPKPLLHSQLCRSAMWRISWISLCCSGIAQSNCANLMDQTNRFHLLLLAFAWPSPRGRVCD